MVRQCGGWRRAGHHRGTHDRCDPTDDCCPSKPGAVVVSITATDDAASEDGGTGTFTITRTGSTVDALPVYFGIGGTAQLGVDYTASASSLVTIPAGSSSVTVTITPLQDAVADVDETVILSIVPGPGLLYDILASAYQDTVTITDVAGEVDLLLMFRFESSPGLLVNEGTLGTDYNLSAGEICEG